MPGARAGAARRCGCRPLSDQDTGRWDGAAIERADAQLRRAAALAARGPHPGRFQLEAAIQSVHAARRLTGRTDRNALATLHAALERVHPTLGGAGRWRRRAPP